MGLDGGEPITSELAFSEGIWFLSAEDTSGAEPQGISSVCFSGSGEVYAGFGGFALRVAPLLQFEQLPPVHLLRPPIRAVCPPRAGRRLARDSFRPDPMDNEITFIGTDYTVSTER